ncbi:hypothetical protein M405DRAFT_856691 [Rhizopogon salebrosus TDB-379]|nr:hypothetical protein M405DRAFT_856691 [Rhizopogon salebrosus TDB-379]
MSIVKPTNVLQGVYGKEATIALDAYWRSIRWPRPVRKAAEKGGHRKQLFVRGLQGSYNAFTLKHGFHLPNGEVLVFCLWYWPCSNGGFGSDIDTAAIIHDMVPSRRLAIASGAPTNAIDMVRDLNRTGTFDVEHLDRILKREDLVPANQATILARKALATSSPPDFGPPYAPRAAVHPWIESCMHVPLPRFFTVFKWAFQIYGALHFVPMMLFKRHAFFKSPSHMVGRASWATIRSSAFLAAFIAIHQSMCFHSPSAPRMSF